MEFEDSLTIRDLNFFLFELLKTPRWDLVFVDIADVRANERELSYRWSTIINCLKIRKPWAVALPHKVLLWAFSQSSPRELYSFHWGGIGWKMIRSFRAFCITVGSSIWWVSDWETFGSDTIYVSFNDKANWSLELTLVQMCWFLCKRSYVNLNIKY